MNFATLSPANSMGAQYVTTATLPLTKIQQNMVANGSSLSQVVGMVGGVGEGVPVQYLRTLEGGATLHAAPHLISVPIALPGSKPGDPQQTVQIQVLNPNITLQAQQQPKYQMQIPIQGLQQGAVLTVAYSPDATDTGGIQLLGNTLPDGLQVVTALPQEMQLMQPAQTQDTKDNISQLFMTETQQIVVNGLDDKTLNNNNAINVVIKEECDENDDESSQGTEASDNGTSWQITPSQHEGLVKYLSQLPPQQAQQLPVSLQQFLRMNPSDIRKSEPIDIEVDAVVDDGKEAVAEAILSEDGTLTIQSKKKKKYKKKPPKPARPKPGQIVIATASDGTSIYCCPECQMAYPEKEHLELHLSVHKIERRFICGICGAGLKRKEHLERHKLGHNPERPYVCGVCHKGFKRREHLNLHTVIHSGVKTEHCAECGKGFYRKDHLRKHTRSHETRRAREEHLAENNQEIRPIVVETTNTDSLMPEITIHVPASEAEGAGGAQAQAQVSVSRACELDALLAHHS